MSPSPEFNWSERLPWLLLLRAPAIALRPGCLAVAFLALALMLVPEWLGLSGAANRQVTVTERAIGPPRFFLLGGSQFQDRAAKQVIGPARSLLPSGMRPTWSHEAIIVWRLMVAVLAGGVMCRIAVLEFTRREQLPLRDALCFAAQRKGQLLAAPAIVLGVSIFFAMPLVAWRWSVGSDWLAWPAVITWPLAAGLALAVTLLGGVLAIAWPLLPAAIATEANDAFDAVSCTYAYVWQRPMRFLFYVGIALGLGWLSGCLVEILGAAIEQATLVFPERTKVTPKLIYWFHALAMVKSSYFWSYHFVAFTAIFLLLRRDVDEKQLDEVWRG